MDFAVAEDIVAIGCTLVLPGPGNVVIDRVPDLCDQGTDAFVDAVNAVVGPRVVVDEERARTNCIGCVMGWRGCRIDCRRLVAAGRNQKQRRHQQY